MLATLLDAVDVIPQLAQVAPDLIVKNVDTPDTDELVRRLRIPLIQQGIIKPTPEEQKNMPPPQQPDPQAQAELQLAQAKAQLAQNKVQASPLERAKLQDDIIHNRFSAMLDARKAGVENAGAAIEQQQQQLEGQQNLAQSQAESQQSLQQSAAEAQQNQQVQGQQAQLDLAHQAVQHVQSLHHAAQTHAQKLTHGKEAHEAKLQQMKQMQAAKPKPTSSTKK
jgi:hypothetical protein